MAFLQRVCEMEIMPSLSIRKSGESMKNNRFDNQSNWLKRKKSKGWMLSWVLVRQMLRKVITWSKKFNHQKAITITYMPKQIMERSNSDNFRSFIAIEKSIRSSMYALCLMFKVLTRK